MAKITSRPKRWAAACANALGALDALDSALADLQSAAEELVELKEEYEEWQSGLPDNLQNSPVADKLQAIADLGLDDLADEIETALGEAREKIEGAEGADLPQGFGRD